MRSAPWLLVIVAIGAIARAEPATGTVIVSCNEADASLIVDGVLLPERTPAVLTLEVGPHVIEARKSPLVPDKKVVQVGDQQPVKVRFELLPANQPPPPIGAGSGAGSAGSGAGSAGSAAGSASGSAAPPAAGSGAGSGSAAPPTVIETSGAAVKASRCTEGGHEVECIKGPHCTEGGRPVPCKKGESLPPALQPPPPKVPPTGPSTVIAATTGAGSGSAAHVEPPRTTPGGPGVEIATTVPHAVAYVDGAPIHDAPCVLQLEAGEHVVAVAAAGMMPAETVIKVEPTKHQRVDLNAATPRKRIDVPAQ